MNLFTEDEDQQSESPTVSQYRDQCSKKVYHAGQSQQVGPDPVDNNMDEHNSPTVLVIQTKEYLNVNKIAEHDHLTDKNWHVCGWTE
jgi:hypothetical protein